MTLTRTSVRNRFFTESQDRFITLAGFQLDDLAQFKREQVFYAGESPDYRTFLVGRDDVHGVLKYLLARCSKSLRLSMFGYDDDELNEIIMGLIKNHHVFVQGTLDKSQAGGVHERKILATWDAATRSSFAIGQSATHQILHTKGAVLDGVVSFEGSTNWSASGEGTGIDLDPAAPRPKGFKAQANTLTVMTNPIEIATFTDRLDEEHLEALRQEANLPK